MTLQQVFPAIRCVCLLLWIAADSAPDSALAQPPVRKAEANDRLAIPTESSRDGEERDGEERDGEERDGEERDGEERDGEERDGEERDGEERNGEDWPQFLGPLGTGVSQETGLLHTWPKQGPPLLWEREVGTGYSAPSIIGNRLVLHHRIGNAEIVECLQANDGTPMWKESTPSSFSDPYGYNNGPRASPVLTADRCYTLGAEGRLSCRALDDGHVIWEHDLQQKFKLPEWFFGVGCSPVLEGDMLIVLVGGQPDSGVVAFDADTGDVRWQSVGKSTWDGVEDERGTPYDWTGDEMVVSYSSPIVATIHGRRHVLCLMRQGLVSLDPQTGTEHFKYWFRPKVHESVNAARPVVIGNRIFVSAAYRLGSALLEVHPDGNSYDIVWRDADNMLNHWSTSILVDGWIYGFTGRHENEGELRCINVDTGELAWKERGFSGNPRDLRVDRSTGQIVNTKTGDVVPFPYFGRGSLIQTGNRFIVLGERGTLALVQIKSNGFEEICRTTFPQIHYPAWTAPVLSRKRLYLRCEDALICLDLNPPNAAQSVNR